MARSWVNPIAALANRRTNPYSIDDLHATILHAQFDVGKIRLDTGLPKIVMERASRGRDC